MLKDVKNFIQKIESMAEKINFSLFEDFFESPSPAYYAKLLINTWNPDENNKIVAETEDRISALKDRIKEMSEKEKESADETLKIIEEIIDYNKRAQRTFLLASEVDKGKSELKVDKGKSEPKVDRRKLELKIKDSVAKRVRLRREKIDEIKEEEKT